MPRYFIEVSHGADPMACVEAIHAFQNAGSHFMTNAEWGCMDGEHKAWIILELDDKEMARMVLPPAYRAKAKVTQLSRFSREEIDNIVASHQEKTG